MDPAAAFPDAQRHPTEAELLEAIGQAAKPFAVVLGHLFIEEPEATTAWQFSDRSGWYLLVLHKKRRLAYVMPKRRDVQLMMILGRKDDGTYFVDDDGIRKRLNDSYGLQENGNTGPTAFQMMGIVV